MGHLVTTIQRKQSRLWQKLRPPIFQRSDFPFKERETRCWKNSFAFLIGNWNPLRHANKPTSSDWLNAASCQFALSSKPRIAPFSLNSFQNRRNRIFAFDAWLCCLRAPPLVQAKVEGHAKCPSLRTVAIAIRWLEKGIFDTQILSAKFNIW